MRYLRTPPAENAWRQGIETWFLDNQITLLHEKRYTKDQSPEILFLKYIYAHKFSLMKNAKTYHIEHIIPVDQLISEMEKGERWPINVVGNLALLEDSENIKKGNLTFVEYLDKLADEGELSSDEYEKALNKVSDQLLCPVSMLPGEITLENLETFIMDRFQVLVD